MLMTMAEFTTAFRGDDVRSWVDWDGLQDLPGARVTVLGDRADLGSCQTVWYRDRHGRRCDWRDPHGVRVDVAEAAATEGFPDAASRRRVLRIRDDLDRAVVDPVLVLPAYRARGDRPILLDGNHRAVAAHLSGARVRVVLMCVQGTADPRLLPDVLHDLPWQGEQWWYDEVRGIERRFEGRCARR